MRASIWTHHRVTYFFNLAKDLQFVFCEGLVKISKIVCAERWTSLSARRLGALKNNFPHKRYTLKQTKSVKRAAPASSVRWIVNSAVSKGTCLGWSMAILFKYWCQESSALVFRPNQRTEPRIFSVLVVSCVCRAKSGEYVAPKCHKLWLNQVRFRHFGDVQWWRCCEQPAWGSHWRSAHQAAVRWCKPNWWRRWKRRKAWSRVRAGSPIRAPNRALK